MRKIIQIAYGESANNECDRATLIALCNDGSVWRLNRIWFTSEQEWIPLKQIPQSKLPGYEEE